MTSAPSLCCSPALCAQTVQYLIVTGPVLLAFAAAFLVLNEPPEPIPMWPWNASLVPHAGRALGQHDCVDWFSSYGPTLQYLVEAALTGDSFFSCGVTTDTPTLAWGMTILFYSITGLLLLNMLIAMSEWPPSSHTA